MKILPVNIITGFLGAGKTTAIINLFSQKTTDDSWAIIINEFGKINIDGKTLQSARVGEVFEITGGCICCTAKGYLNETLQAVIDAGKFSRIIIEPTGLGGIEIVSEVVAALPNLVLMPIICLVDIQLVSNPKVMRVPIFRAQVLKSDIIVFSKTDLLLNETQLSEFQQQFLESFPQVTISTNTMDISLLDIDSSTVRAQTNKSAFAFIDPNLLATNYTQKLYTFAPTHIFSALKVQELIRSHPSILRAKGNIRTEMGWKMLNMTLATCEFEHCEDCEQTEFVVIADASEPMLETVLYSELLIAIL